MIKSYTKYQPGQLITRNTHCIKVSGHQGYWYVIDEMKHEGRCIFLLEHENFGDEAASIVVDENGNVLAEDIYNGFDDYFEN